MAIDYTWTNAFFGDHYNNTLAGSVGHDEIYGYGGDDIIVGDYGEDYIDGNNGDDLLAGRNLEGFFDPEPDIFVFDPDDGNDTITDFTPPCYGCLYPSPGDQIMLLGGTPDDVGVILAKKSFSTFSWPIWR